MKYKIHILFLILLISTPLVAQTNIDVGTINNGHWTADESPYYINVNLAINNLIIDPGVVIQFTGDYRFEINSGLQAEGFYSDSIYFQSRADNPAGWKGMKFKTGGALSSLAFCRIEDANDQGIKVEAGNVEISNCRIVNNRDDGFHLKDAAIELKNCVISNNAVDGIVLDNGQIVLINSIVSGNGTTGFNSTDNSDEIALINCVIADNQDSGIDFPNGILTIKNTIIYNNTTQIISDAGNTTVTYSNIEGGEIYPGTGNINSPPQFADSLDYTLSELSLCIDAGDSVVTYNDLYFPPSLGGSRNDIGAYGGLGASGWYPPLYILPQSVQFGQVRRDSSQTVIIEVQNYRDTLIVATDILFEDNDSGVFTTDQLPFILNKLQNIPMSLIFTPDELADFSSNLVIHTLAHGDVFVPLQGEGIKPTIDLLVSELDFDFVPLGESMNLELPIRNSGNDTLIVNLTSPANSAFSTDQSTLIIEPDSTTNIVLVSFTPDSIKLYQDYLIVLSNDPDNSSLAVSLTGEGLGPLISLDKDSLKFGSRPVLTDTSLQVSVYNYGNDTLRIDSLNLHYTEAELTAFTIMDSAVTYPKNIEPDSQYTVTIRFIPENHGLYSEQLHIYSNDPFQSEHLVGISGTGLRSEIVLSTTDLDFGNVFLGEDSIKIFTIKNIGNDTLSVDSLYLSQADSAFILEDIPLPLPLNIEPNDSIIVSIRFSPQDPGFATGRIFIISNDPFNGKDSIAVTGRGLSSDQVPIIEVSATTLDFGQIPLAEDSTRMIYIYNHGSANLIVHLKISGQDSLDYHIENIPYDSIIIPFDSLGIAVQFDPQKTGPLQSQLKILNNDPIDSLKTISLTGFAYDTQAATISFDSENSTNPFISGQAADISFTITDVSSVDSALIFVRQGGKNNFVKMTLTNQNGSGNWWTQLESEIITPRGVEYYVRVDHGWRSTYYPQNGGDNPNAISVVVPDLPLLKTKQKTYQMISIPLSTSGQDLNDLFANNLGGYDNSKYRIFDCLNGADYTEITTMSDSMPPGKAIWLITKESTDLNVADGKSVPTDRDFALQLKKGWNMIATPFLFPIDWEQVSDHLLPWYFEGTEWQPVSLIEPFKGYAVKVDADTLIMIPPIEATSALPKIMGLTFSSPAEWQIQLIAQKEEFRDQYNYAGVIEAATSGIDRYNYPEPPPIGDYVSLYFLSTEQNGLYATDYRKSGDEGYTFSFELKSNIEGSKTIQIHPEKLPTDVDWIVVSDETRVNHGKEPIFTSNNQVKYNLIVGTSSYISGVVSDYQTFPTEFELSQNYPNPFNPNTWIKYQLPKAQKVTIKIYNILGQLVKTLAENELKEAGYYQIQWDGTNTGDRKMASGIYFLNLQTEAFNRAIKMVLQK